MSECCEPPKKKRKRKHDHHSCGVTNDDDSDDDHKNPVLRIFLDSNDIVKHVLGNPIQAAAQFSLDELNAIKKNIKVLDHYIDNAIKAQREGI